MFDKNKLDGIGKRIKDVRESKKITQEALGEIIGLGKSGISKIENNGQAATLAQIADIAHALDVRIEYLLGLDKDVDKETEFVKNFISSFKRIATTKKYFANNDGIYNGKELIFCTKEDYLVLTGSESLFTLIKEIATAENLKSELASSNYNNMIRMAKRKFKQNKDKGKADSYFLISGKQMTEIIESAVINQIYGEALFKEITTPSGQPLPKLKIIRKK